MRKVSPSPALVEMLERSGEPDAILSGRGLIFENPPPQAVEYGPPLEVPPADWDQERREREDVDACDIELRSVALVREPAATCVRPVEILVGDLASTVDRRRWRVDSATRDRLERAAEQLGYRRSNDPVHVRNHSPERERLLRRRDWTPAEMAMALEDAKDDRRPPGPLRIRPAQIISVR